MLPILKGFVLRHAAGISFLVAYGELAIGISLLMGLWTKPASAFGSLDLTTFISSSPELALPSTLAPDRLDAGSRRLPSRERRPPRWGEVTLSQELRPRRRMKEGARTVLLAGAAADRPDF